MPDVDFSTTLGIIGVLLTAVFFVVGYRQTIGARKERARAANKTVCDILFRRLTLEENFFIDSVGVTRLLSGLAIESRVRLSDLYSIEEIHASIYFKLLESDYIPSERRQEIIGRLDNYFGDPARINNAGSSEPRQKSNWPIEVSLAGLSVFFAGAFVVLVDFLSGDQVSFGSLSPAIASASMGSAIAIGFALLFTALGLTIFVRLRDSTRSTDEREVSDATLGMEFEKRFLEKAKKANQNVEIPKFGWPDLYYTAGDKKFAVEVKVGLERMSSAALRRFFRVLNDIREIGGYDSVFLVVPDSAIPYLSKSKFDFNTDKITVVTSGYMEEKLRSQGAVGGNWQQ